MVATLSSLPRTQNPSRSVSGCFRHLDDGRQGLRWASRHFSDFISFTMWPLQVIGSFSLWLSENFVALSFKVLGSWQHPWIWTTFSNIGFSRVTRSVSVRNGKGASQIWNGSRSRIYINWQKWSSKMNFTLAGPTKDQTFLQFRNILQKWIHRKFSRSQSTPSALAWKSDWKYNVYGGQTCTCIDLVGIDYAPEPYRTQTRRLFNTHTHRQDVCTASHRPLFFGSPTIVSQFYSIRTRETETEQHWLIHSQAIHDGASRSFDSSESSERTVLRDRSKWLREGLDQWCFDEERYADTVIRVPNRIKRCERIAPSWVYIFIAWARKAVLSVKSEPKLDNIDS